MQLVLLALLATLTVLAAVVPAVLYSLLVWWLDRYEREPWGLLAATFIWGAIPAIVLSLGGEFLLGVPFSALLGEASGQIIGGTVVAPVVEEAVKGVALLLLFLIFRWEFDGPLDGIVYGALVGFGFGMTENLFYFLAGLLEGGTGSWSMVVFTRTMVFGLNHAMFTSITGIGFGYASIATNVCTRWLAPPLAFGGAILAHAVHNVSTRLAADLCWPVVISLANAWGGVFVLLAIVFFSWDRERRCIVEELGEEVGTGTITDTEYQTLASYRQRAAAQRRALSKHGLREARLIGRFHQLATELAFTKYRLRSGRAGERGQREVSRLRDQIRFLRAEMPED
jgi:RsiW-degrading membrane proteinase PrsW (M82 family)